nr:hypothetical protein [uncultured Acinetobacter sp.]
MSFFTELQVRHTDFEEVDLSSQKNKILEIFSEDGIHEDVYHKLVDAFKNGTADLNIDSVACLQFIEKCLPFLAIFQQMIECLNNSYKR